VSATGTGEDQKAAVLGDEMAALRYFASAPVQEFIPGFEVKGGGEKG